MGSFDGTCAVSGLPIGAGDKVRWLVLGANPYFEGGCACYPHDIWYPRSLPVRAKCNDYGSIEGYDAGGLAVRSIRDVLARDLVEVGVGDNLCHDVATSRDMSFESLLAAIWEGLR